MTNPWERDEVVEAAVRALHDGCDDPDCRDYGMNWWHGAEAHSVLAAVGPMLGGDKYHSLDELYGYRMADNALAANAMPERCVKSWRHSDGELCFGGGRFVVVMGRATPRALPSPAGFVTHQNGVTVTHAITPGVGMSLGQLAALVDLAFRGGHSSTDRVQVRINARKRGGDRFGHRIEGICITPGPTETGEVAS